MNFRWFAVAGLLLLSGCALAVRFPAFSVPRSTRPNLFRGVFHVHSKFSHDSKASLKRIVQTAKRAGLDFVVVTDHNTRKGAQSYQNMDLPKRPLLIFASEISTDSGHVVALGVQKEPPRLWPAKKAINWIRKEGGHPIIAHPTSLEKPWTQWKLHGINGMETFSFSDVYYSKEMKELTLKTIFLTPKYFLNSVAETPRASLELWGARLGAGRMTAFGSVDAHLRWQWIGFAPENYLLYFQAVTMYVFAEKLDEASIVEALAGGKSFIAHEGHGVAQNFSFQAKIKDKSYGPGASLPPSEGIVFSADVPQTAEIRLIRNGQLIHQVHGQELKHAANERGAYFIEAHRDGKLWIVSNPIYVGRDGS